MGTAGEGIGALWRLAGAEPMVMDLAAPIAERLTCMAGYMAERQVVDAGAPVEERGAWFYRGHTQMDDQQHVVSALLSALAVLEEDGA